MSARWIARWLRRIGLLLVTVLLVTAGLLVFWPVPAPSAAVPFAPTAQEEEELAFYSQPESWFLQQLQHPLEVIDGQRLDPKFQYMLEQTRPATRLMPYTMPAIFSVERGRRWVRASIDRQWQLYTRVTAPMARVEDRQIPGRDGAVTVRIYHPDVDDAGPLPVLVYAHGGGWVFASVAALDRAVRLMANEARAIVISVEYRLAPEHPYPAASDDCEDAFLWARANAASFGGDAERVGVGGDSAGGHAAINVVQRQLMTGRPVPRALLLYYPGTGLPQQDRSFALFGNGYGLDAAFIDFILPRVFPDFDQSLDDEGLDEESRDRPDALMDPLRAGTLRGFPPSIIATAGFDILRDSGRAFAQRLREEGVPVAYFNGASLIHSFLQFSAVVADAERVATQTARLFGDTVRSGALTVAPFHIERAGD